VSRGDVQEKAYLLVFHLLLVDWLKLCALPIAYEGRQLPIRVGSLCSRMPCGAWLLPAPTRDGSCLPCGSSFCKAWGQ
jgi:hypothetical protein